MRLQVLYGLPHRPWHADYPGNTQIGRFIKHISILKCEACAKDGSYIAGEVGATPRASTSDSVDHFIGPCSPALVLGRRREMNLGSWRWNHGWGLESQCIGPAFFFFESALGAF